jgi:hypothetical protein
MEFENLTDQQQLSHEERVELARLTMNILQSWGLSAAQQVSLLDMPEDVRPRTMQRYLHDTPLPDTPGVNQRIAHVLGIADALRTSFPLNEQMGSFWLNRSNKRFGNRAPLSVMLEDGLPGVLSVRMHLDCAYDWHIDDQGAQS